MTHAGWAMVVLGVAGSSLAKEAVDLSLKVGKSATVGSYTIRLDSFKDVRHSHYTAVEAGTTVLSNSGKTFTLSPEQRFYDKEPDQPRSVVDLRAGLRDDVYLILAGGTEDGTAAVIRVLIYPLVTWIWIGSIVMVVGGTLCVLHRRPRRVEQAQPQAGLKTTARLNKNKCAAVAAEV